MLPNLYVPIWVMATFLFGSVNMKNTLLFIYDEKKRTKSVLGSISYHPDVMCWDMFHRVKGTSLSRWLAVTL